MARNSLEAPPEIQEKALTQNKKLNVMQDHLIARRITEAQARGARDLEFASGIEVSSSVRSEELIPDIFLDAPKRREAELQAGQV